MTSSTSSKRSHPFQFGIGTILIVTTLGAGIFAISRWIDAPIEWQIGIGCYFFLLLLYFAFRVPYLVRVVFGKGSNWEQAQQKREELEALAEQRRNTQSQPAQSDNGP